MGSPITSGEDRTIETATVETDTGLIAQNDLDMRDVIREDIYARTMTHKIYNKAHRKTC